MKLDGEFVFEAGVQDVWDALFDPQVLAAVMPGCEKLDLVDGSYIGELKVKVGPIQGKFTGKVDLLDLKEPTSYRMVVDGRGAQGFVKATATIVLEQMGDKTRIRYESEAQVGGKIASVGQRLVETSAKAIVKQSLDGLNENIQIRVAAYRAHAAASTAPTPVAAAEIVAATVPVPEAPVIEAAKLAPAEAVVEAPVAKVAEAAIDPVPKPEVVVDPAAKPAAKPVEAVVETVKPVASEPPKPVVEYKRADPKKIAGAVAKEVTKSLAPILLLVVAVLGVAIYFFVVR